MKTSTIKLETSIQVQKAMTKKITESMWIKTENRFFELHENQLLARVMKMTNPVKLEATRQLAKIHGFPTVKKLAKEKRDFMFDVGVVKPWSSRLN